MKLTGKRKKLRIYLDEDLRMGKVPLYRAILEIFLKEGASGATVFKGHEGFGFSHQLHTSRIIEMTERLPMVVEVVEEPKKLQKSLNLIGEILPAHCLVTIEDVKVLDLFSPKGNPPKRK